MKILWISEAGFSADLALRATFRGHKVRFWIKENHWKQVYDGLLNKVDDWKPHVQWCDFVMFDHTGMSSIWEQVSKQKPCFGGSKFADKLEKDRPYAKQVFKNIGLQDFEHEKFNNIDQTIAHLKHHKVMHVVKPVGKQVDSHHVIISEDKNGEDAIGLLESFKNQGLAVDYIEVEERKLGVEVGVSGWFISDNRGAGDWSGDININFEHKRFATGYPEGIGFLTGEMGTAMRYDSRENVLFLKTLDHIKPLLQKENYSGQIDISFIANDEGFWPLEATPRLGYPACLIEEPLQKTDFAELFYRCAKHDYFENQVSRDWAIGVVCATQGFPSREQSEKCSYEFPVLNSNKNVHLVEVKKSLNRMVTSKGMGYAAVVTGTGTTIQEAKASCYRNISYNNLKRFRVPNMFYRTDIGDRVIRQMPEIERYSILKQSDPLPIALLLT